jgi:hypothetical protein
MAGSAEAGSPEVSRTLRVVLDSTVFCDDFMLQKNAARQLRTAAAEGRVVVHVSRVVVDEVNRRYREDVWTEGRSIVDKARQFSGGRFGNVLQVNLEDPFRKAREDYSGILDRLMQEPGLVVEPYPEVSHEDLVARDLQRKLPFRQLKDGSIGYRDALIWTTALEIAEQHPDDMIVFVTNNPTDYTDTKSQKGNKKESSDGKGVPTDSGPAPYELAEELFEEVAVRLGSADRVRLARNLDEVASVFLPTTTEIPDAVLPSGEPNVLDLLKSSSDDRAVLLEALFEAAPLLRGMSFDHEWDPRDGGDVPPQFDLGLPSWMFQTEVNDITGPLGLAVTSAIETQTAGEWIVTTHHLATLRFEGFATKADYYVYDDPDVDLLDPDWNAHVVLVATDRVVGVTSDVRCRLEGTAIVAAEVIQIINVNLVSTGSAD